MELCVRREVASIQEPCGEHGSSTETRLARHFLSHFRMGQQGQVLLIDALGLFSGCHSELVSARQHVDECGFCCDLSLPADDTQS